MVERAYGEAKPANILQERDSCPSMNGVEKAALLIYVRGRPIEGVSEV
jgi:hypothetical protein